MKRQNWNDLCELLLNNNWHFSVKKNESNYSDDSCFSSSVFSTGELDFCRSSSSSFDCLSFFMGFAAKKADKMLLLPFVVGVESADNGSPIDEATDVFGMKAASPGGGNTNALAADPAGEAICFWKNWELNQALALLKYCCCWRNCCIADANIAFIFALDAASPDEVLSTLVVFVSPLALLGVAEFDGRAFGDDGLWAGCWSAAVANPLIAARLWR